MKYELVVIVDPKTEEKQAQAQLSTLLEKEGFTVSELKFWGKKRLAYPINKQTDGFYVSIMITGNSKPQQILDRFKLEEMVLRALIIKQKERGKNV